MTWFLKPGRSCGLWRLGLLAGCAVLGVRAGALEEWLQHAVAGSPVEAALYRAMALPGVEVLFPRPPGESVAALGKLLVGSAPEVSLYGLRAHQEEQALDFRAAEADWKAYAAKSPDRAAGLLALADYYHRRLAVQPEYLTLLAVATIPAAPAEALTQPLAQRSWRALERALTLAGDQAFADAAISGLWQRWIARYPDQSSVYARGFTWQLGHGRVAEAEEVLARYRVAFPQDEVFPLKATALLALHRAGADRQQRALAVYDAGFQPLWPEELVKSYFDLLDATHQARRFLAAARERLQRDPEDLSAAARIFLYDRRQGHPEAALEVLAAYVAGKDDRHSPWTAVELYTLAQLTAAASAYPEAARYDFALAHAGGALPGGRSAQEAGLAGMVDVLLTAPEQPIELGAGNLSMYRDIGTLDQGPGYWNGILSLWFNGQSVANEYAQEEQKAQPYFHRAKAAELLALLDREAPGSPVRDSLHAKLLEAYAGYGDNAAVVHEGSVFLAAFPKSSQRVPVALAMADAYARENDSAAEFALYDRLLEELGRQTQKMPLTAAALQAWQAPGVKLPDSQEDLPGTAGGANAFELDMGAPRLAPNPAAAAYAEVLDRYLGRLSAMHQLPQALAVLRKELDRNPDDPALYERLASFLEQNNLSAQQEEVYRRAIQKFQDTGWYDKLARLYLRQQRLRAFAKLSREVTDIFSGTDLDAYFRTMHSGGSQLFVEVNLYAHQRFPHDLDFTENLLEAYRGEATRNDAAEEALLRQSWWQTPELTRRFFEFLSASGKLDAEVAQLGPAPVNPAAQEELGEAELWRSHYEQGAPVFAALASAYPADERLGRTAADLERSLAWLDPAGPAGRIAAAVQIEERLLSTNPGDVGRLARIGDMLADHADGSAASLAPAAAFWRRMPAVAPGRPDNYLQAATVFWDYFQFDDALREIDQARVNFHQPTLFGYEAGAIAEGKRDEPLAVREYVRSALAADAGRQSGDPSTTRLLQLARRPGTAALVDAAATAVEADTGIAGLRLRVAVLAAQHRSSETGPLLLAAVQRATAAGQLEQLATYAQALGQGQVREVALAREAGLTEDPVERLALRYELAHAYESRGDVEEAASLVEATYKDNPRVLRVVRATVDFDWRAKRRPQAIAVLLEAARAAQPELARQFTAEAAAKANEAGDTGQARQLAESLLAGQPYNAEYLALAAASYAGDDAGLARFYAEHLEAVRTAPMAEADRKTRTALLRKGMIPALTRGANYTGGVDQYIALVSAYPEDSTLVEEAALYALRYDRRQQLLDFLGTTTKASPRDSRFFVDLAQVQAVFGEPAAAIEAYARAIAIRKDRSDLYTAKAALEETLGRYDEAAQDYGRLYRLSYNDPQWMVATARARARQGRSAEVVAALEAAYLHGAQSAARDYFSVASQLEAWNLLDEAGRYAGLGAKAAGDELLAGESQGVGSGDPVTYARILTRLRQTGTAFTTLRSALAAAGDAPSPAGMVNQIRAQGLASVTGAEWREQRAAVRRQQAAAQFNGALEAMSAAVDLYDTPEEKAAYAAMLTRQRQGAPAEELAERWVPAAHAAGLAALETAWRKELLLGPAAMAEAGPQVEPYAALERARLLFEELAQTLEALLRRLPAGERARHSAVEQAADAYHAAGGFRGETKLLRAADQGSGMLRDRYLELLLQHDPDALVAAAGSGNQALADAAANLALARGTRTIGLAAVDARGRALPAVWGSSYGALAGLYLRDTSAGTGAAFEQALRTQATIADRLAARPDTARQLTGAPWFYDAARYGEWRTLSPGTAGDAEEVLAADLEAKPVAANYVTLADTYAEAGNTPAALVEMDHALELDPDSAGMYDAKAALLWGAGRKPEAVAAWQAALGCLRTLEDRGPAPESFWTLFKTIARRVHTRALFAQLKPRMEDVLRVYLSRNAGYRSDELLQAAFAAAPDPLSGADWLLSLATAASDPPGVLESVDSAAWLPAPAREAVLAGELRMLRGTTDQADGQGWRLARAESALLNLYVEQHQDAQALRLLDSFTEVQRAMAEFELAAAVLAGRTGRVDALLAGYRARPGSAPEAKTLESAAAALTRDKQLKPARALLEFAFARGQAAHALVATEYLALAEIRLQTGDDAGAVAVLEALGRVEGDTYANLDSAAMLLEQHDRPADAIAFLTTLTRGVPWELSYAVRLAEAQQRAHGSSAPAAAALVGVARSPLAPYALRTRAALALAQVQFQPAELGSGELSLLASAKVPASASRQPYFAMARAVAASQVEDPHLQAQLLQEALAIMPSGVEAPSRRLALFRAQSEAGERVAARASLDVLFETGSSAVLNELPAAGAQAALDKQVAAVYLGTGDRGAGIPWLKRAAKAMQPGAEASAVEHQVAGLEAAARREAANTARRPLIRPALEQPAIVRPRLDAPAGGAVAPEPDAAPTTEEP